MYLCRREFLATLQPHAHTQACRVASRLATISKGHKHRNRCSETFDARRLHARCPVSNMCVCVCVDALRWLEGPKGLNRARFASTLLRVPTSLPSRPHIHLLLPFRRPLFIRSPGIRGETWPHTSSHGPNNGGHTRAPGLLFARSCFDEVGTRPHNTHSDLSPLSFCFLFSTRCFRPSPFLSSLSAVSFVPFYAPVLHVSSSLSAFWPLKRYKRKDEEEASSYIGATISFLPRFYPPRSIVCRPCW